MTDNARARSLRKRRRAAPDPELSNALARLPPVTAEAVRLGALPTVYAAHSLSGSRFCDRWFGAVGTWRRHLRLA